MKWFKNKSGLVIMIICMLFIFLPVKTVLTIENTGSISLYAHYLENGKVIEFSDMPFQIVKVAELVNGQFVNREEFQSFKNISTNMNASEMKEVSFELQEYMKRNKIPFTYQKHTNQNGYVQFSSLEIGLYLVSQKESNDMKYYSEPFLIAIPMVEDGSEILNVYAKPKFIEKTENETPMIPVIPDDSVGTGDHTNAPLWTILLLVSGFILLNGYRKSNSVD